MAIHWKGEHIYSGPVKFLGGVVGASPFMGSGKVLFVNGESTVGYSAADDNDGTNPERPLATIAQAVSLCTQRTQDYIFVQGSYTDDTFPITLNKRNIRVIGIGQGQYKGQRALLDGAGEACFLTSTLGGGTEIAGFDMGSTGQADACILAGGITWQMYIHHCTFGSTILGQDGILGADAANYLAYSTIEHNYFDMQLSRDGIRLYSGGRCRIRNNEFTSYGGIGINIFTGGNNDGVIVGNMFCQTAAALDDGDAITLGGYTTNTLVNLNYAMDEGDTCDNLPFYDASGASLAALNNAWGLNYRGTVVVKPKYYGQ